jgi:hypothetical protein
VVIRGIPAHSEGMPSLSIMPGQTWRDTWHKALCPVSLPQHSGLQPVDEDQPSSAFEGSDIQEQLGAGIVHYASDCLSGMSSLCAGMPLITSQYALNIKRRNILKSMTHRAYGGALCPVSY